MYDHNQPGRPRFCRIPAAIEYSGISRSGLYELAPKWPGLFRKNGAATLIDFSVLDSILDALPPAEIEAPPPRKRSAAQRRNARPRRKRQAAQVNAVT
jgi:hypothetical protein